MAIWSDLVAQNRFPLHALLSDIDEVNCQLMQNKIPSSWPHRKKLWWRNLDGVDMLLDYKQHLIGLGVNTTTATQEDRGQYKHIHGCTSWQKLHGKPILGKNNTYISTCCSLKLSLWYFGVSASQFSE